MGDGEWREREVDAHNFRCSCPRRGCYSCGFCIFEVPLGWEKRGGKEREKLLVSAFGGLLRDPIGSTEYWEIDRAVMRFS